MAVIEGADFSWSRPDPACLRSQGMLWVGRYLVSSDPGKSLSRAEADRYAANGLSIVSIHQPSQDKGWMLGGFQRGVAAATDALAVGRACRMPEDRPFTYALDTDPRILTAGQWDLVRQCLRGAASVHGLARTWVYGGYLAMERLIGAYAAGGYQTYAWSDGQWHPKAAIHQYRNNVTLCGGTIDHTRAVIADYGQWRPGWSPAGGWWTRPLGDRELGQLRGAFEGALG